MGGRLAAVILAVLLAAAPLPGWAAAPLEALLSRVQNAGRSTRTLQADFTQRKRMPMFKSEVVSKGRLAFARPDRLRWETLAPDPAVLVLRGPRAELRLPGEPVRTFKVGPGNSLGVLIEQMLVWLGVRPAGELRFHFEVSLQGSAAEPQLHLVPKEAALKKQVTSLDIWLGKDLAPSRLQVTGGEGELTRIEFGPVRRNLPLPDSLFR